MAPALIPDNIEERMARRASVVDPLYMAEAISLVFWNPEDGVIDPNAPESETLRFEAFSRQVESAYASRYKGLPPHAPD